MIEEFQPRLTSLEPKGVTNRNPILQREICPARTSQGTLPR